MLNAGDLVKAIFYSILMGVVIFGVYARFVGINQNHFVYYDEGMWLNQNRDFVEYAAAKSREGFSQLPRLLNISFHLSLQTAKSLWAFIAQSRAYFGGAEAWYFIRMVAALFGVLTIPAVFIFTRSFYGSRDLALLAAAMLAVLPSHVYYSRIGLQETLSAFLFIVGIGLYLSCDRRYARAFFSGIIFAFIFFANYRMIIIPVIIVFIEGYMSWSQSQVFNWRRYVISMAAFTLTVAGVGVLDGGANAKITFSWMTHQADLAEGTRSFFNFLSFPYYLFRLESIPFGFLFFTSCYSLAAGFRRWGSPEFRRVTRELFPFFLACFLMIVFSLPQDKAARYLCVGMPFFAIAAARVCMFWWENKSTRWPRVAVGVLVCILFLSHVIRSNIITGFKTDYELAVREIRHADPSARFISTQNQIQGLFVKDFSDVRETPKTVPALVQLYAQGYRYFMLDPQAYVSMTEDRRRFTEPLRGYLGFISRSVKPIKVYPHFSYPLLERFVFEHNENLRQSIVFLDSARENKKGELRVYDVQACLSLMKQLAGK